IPMIVMTWLIFTFVLYVSVWPSGNLYSSLTWARAAGAAASASSPAPTAATTPAPARRIFISHSSLRFGSPFPDRQHAPGPAREHGYPRARAFARRSRLLLDSDHGSGALDSGALNRGADERDGEGFRPRISPITRIGNSFSRPVIRAIRGPFPIPVGRSIG